MQRSKIKNKEEIGVNTLISELKNNKSVNGIKKALEKVNINIPFTEKDEILIKEIFKENWNENPQTFKNRWNQFIAPILSSVNKTKINKANIKNFSEFLFYLYLGNDRSFFGTGTGPGEYLIQFLMPEINVSGGKESFDLNINGKHIEVKQGYLKKIKILGNDVTGIFNFRVGKSGRELVFKLISDLSSVVEYAEAYSLIEYGNNLQIFSELDANPLEAKNEFVRKLFSGELTKKTRLKFLEKILSEIANDEIIEMEFRFIYKPSDTGKTNHWKIFKKTDKGVSEISLSDFSIFVNTIKKKIYEIEKEGEKLGIENPKIKSVAKQVVKEANGNIVQYFTMKLSEAIKSDTSFNKDWILIDGDTKKGQRNPTYYMFYLTREDAAKNVIYLEITSGDIKPAFNVSNQIPKNKKGK